LFTVWGGIAWLILIAVGLALASVHWNTITHDIVDQALAPQNLVLLWFVYPVVKAVHEFGHAYAVKRLGGDVPEMGIMFLVFVPVPYVDASAATAFTDKYQRMLVGAIGIMVEMALAAIALIAWIYAGPGGIHAFAYNVMLIGGVSTILFNGNPLLRFDGYYVLSDAIEIPNLGQRSNSYWGYLARRYLLGSRDEHSPARSNGERRWFIGYGALSAFYRFYVILKILLYIGTKFFVVGVLLALWAASTQVLTPIAKVIKAMVSGHQLRRTRGRALLTASLLPAAALLVIFVLPLPLWIRAEAVTWPSEHSQVRAAQDGVVVRLLARDGETVRAGTPLIEMTDPFLEARVRVLQAQLAGLELQYVSLRNTDRVEAGVVQEEIAAVRSDLQRNEEKKRELTLVAPRDGTLIVPQVADLPDRMLKKGQLAGYVLDSSDRVTARAIVTQDEINLVRERTRGVRVIAPDWGAESAETKIVREVPGGVKSLPAPALGAHGGGRIALDPHDAKGLTAFERVFEFEIVLPDSAARTFVGQRANVRFDLGYEPIGFQVYRSLRQTFLRLFSV